MDAFARFAQPWLDRAARIGADPRDDDDVRLRKALLVLICVLILPISLVWGAIYLSFGVTAGLIAWLYLLISAGAIAIFARTRDTGGSCGSSCSTSCLPRRSRWRSWAASCRPAPSDCGHPGPARRPRVQRRAQRGALVHRLRRAVPLLANCRRGDRWRVDAPTVVRQHDDRAQRRRCRCRRVRAPRAVRSPARGGARGATGRAGPCRDPAVEHPAAVDRRAAQADTVRSRTVRRGRSCLPTSSTSRCCRTPGAGRGGRSPRRPLHALRPLAERYSLEKIKTIGDAYMVAAGVPTPRADHARVMALMAIDMLEAMSSDDTVGHLGFELGSGSTRARSWPASSAGSASCTTSGATR